MQIQDGEQQPLGYSLHRFAEDQQRWHMSEVAETQFLRLANVKDTHLFTLELRGQGLCYHVTLSAPRIIFRAGFFPSQVEGKGPKDFEYAPKNTVYKMSENLGFPFSMGDSATKRRSRVIDCTAAGGP